MGRRLEIRWQMENVWNMSMKVCTTSDGKADVICQGKPPGKLIIMLMLNPLLSNGHFMSCPSINSIAKYYVL
jgi:hypothetical protein